MDPNPRIGRENNPCDHPFDLLKQHFFHPFSTENTPSMIKIYFIFWKKKHHLNWYKSTHHQPIKLLYIKHDVSTWRGPMNVKMFLPTKSWGRILADRTKIAEALKSSPMLSRRFIWLVDGGSWGGGLVVFRDLMIVSCDFSGKSI